MANFWSTKSKRIYASVAMALTAWHGVSMSGLIPGLPSVFNNAYGNITLLTVVSVYTVYAAYQVYSEEI